MICIWGVDIPIDFRAINEVLQVPHVSDAHYIAKAQEIDMAWLRVTVVLKEFSEQVYWPSTEGVTNTHFLTDARRWLNLVTQDSSVKQHYRCDLSSDPGVTCVIRGI
ncbi:hypothetical protein FXO38_03251 [Capsicum annuum]|nr:hypothetical protein FXO38_03251 [Capsicum annuum]